MRRTPVEQRHILLVAFLAMIALPGGSAVASPGELDSRFGRGGVAALRAAPGSAPDHQQGLAVQRDGKVLVGGESFMGSDRGWQWRITRLLRDGAVDQTFGDDGVALIDMATSDGSDGRDERMTSIAVQADGKILAAGYVLSSRTDQDSALARFNVDGTLDATFGSGGALVTDIVPSPQHDFINHVMVDAKGRIVVGGGCRRAFVARYTPQGHLDPSFHRSGPRPGVNIVDVAPGGANAEILGMTFDDRGRIVASGYTATVDRGVDAVVARFTADGPLDSSFNGAGAVPGVVVHGLAPHDGWDVAFRVAVDSAGRILTVGDAYVGVGAGLYDIALSRYTAGGDIDESFGSGGTVLTNAGPHDSDDDAQGLVVQANGKILVGGSAAPTAFTVDSDFMVARFLPNGRPDRTFGGDGIVVTPIAPGVADDEIWAMALQGPSRLVASGECEQPGTGRDVCVVRYDLGQLGLSG